MAKYSNGDYIRCPYCQREGRVIKAYAVPDAEPEYDVVHKFEWQQIRSTATGNFVPCEVLVDACWRGKETIRPPEDLI